MINLFKQKIKYLRVTEPFHAIEENKYLQRGELILVTDTNVAMVVDSKRAKMFKKHKINDKSIVEEVEL